MADCPDGNLQTCDETTGAQITFYVAPNATGDLEYAPPQGYSKAFSIVNTDNRFAYTVYNISEYTSDLRHPQSMAGKFVHEDNETSYLQGFVARLHGCRCDDGFTGEYCGKDERVGAAAHLGPSLALLALAATLAALLALGD